MSGQEVNNVTVNLEENIAPDASDCSNSQEAMETANASPTTEVQNSLGSVSMQENERLRYEKELDI